MDCGESKSENVTRKRNFYKILLPFRCEKQRGNEIPFYDIGFFSFISLSWLSSKIWALYKRGGANVQWWDCAEPETSLYNLEKIEHLWRDEVNQKGSRASLKRVIFQVMSFKFFWSTFFLMLGLSFRIFTPFYLVPSLLEYMSTDDRDITYGVILAVSIFASELLRSLCFLLMWLIGHQNAITLKVALNALLYKKVLNIKSLKDKTAGQLINIFTADGERLCEAIRLLPFVFGSPPIIIAGLIYNYFLIGPLSLIGSFIFLSFYPILIILNKIAFDIKKRMVKITDTRVNLTHEILNYIRLIKMYAWEESFAEKVKDIRKSEKKLLEKAAYIQTINSCLPHLAPITASILTFLAYILTKQDLTITQAFTMITVLNSVHIALSSLPYTFKAAFDSLIGIRRYQDILHLDDLQKLPRSNLKDDQMIVFENATLDWDNSNNATGKPKTLRAENGTTSIELLENVNLLESARESTLKDISFILEKNTTIGICGSIGSGKSSLISAILGRMNLVSGKMSSRGTIAYVPQQPWIINGTIQDNILFGLPYDEDRYNDVIKVCSLNKDLKDFPQRDMTEIGDRGINISGGQKQRVSLARAVYSDQDLYLLDSPLSAVDIHIGKNIFEECISVFLSNKTVVFVTHQLQYLNSCDHVLFLKDGRLCEQGTHQEMISAKLEYASLIDTFFSDTTSTNKMIREEPIPYMSFPSFHQSQSVLSRQLSTMSTGSQYSLASKVFDGPDLITEEDASRNAGLKERLMYLRACGGMWLGGFVFLLFTVTLLIQSSAGWWLTYWLKSTTNQNITNEFGNVTTLQGISSDPNLVLHSSIYGIIGIFIFLFHVIRGFTYVKTVLRGSSNLHEQMLSSIIRLPMSFFDCTPVGRIINRFSADMQEIDIRLPLVLEIAIGEIIMLVILNLSMAVIMPKVSVIFIVLLVIFGILSRIFIASLLEIKKRDNISRSPLISFISSSIYGLSSIVAYGRNQLFLDRYCKLQDKNTSYHFTFSMVDRWIALRLEFICNLILFSFVLSIVLLGNVSAAFVGLGITFALQAINQSYYAIRFVIETEARFDSLKRITEYITPQETKADSKSVAEIQPPPEWPENGHIEFLNYSMSYREGLPNALKKINLNILPKQRLGIAGRSGSGKSSLGLALFRMVEPSEGTIKIDDRDITKIELANLRSRISIIPQDPVLFAGTIRYNLDPFKNYEDSEIWKALENCYMKNAIAALEKGMESNVEEDGKNFSVGERQLLCMARVLLRKSKVLVLDEATSAIDAETDHLIQKTIKESFNDCTMLIIAHRINTIIECDNIVILDSGKIIERGNPSVLLKKKHSKFRKMWDATEMA